MRYTFFLLFLQLFCFYLVSLFFWGFTFHSYNALLFSFLFVSFLCFFLPIKNHWRLFRMVVLGNIFFIITFFLLWQYYLNKKDSSHKVFPKQQLVSAYLWDNLLLESLSSPLKDRGAFFLFLKDLVFYRYHDAKKSLEKLAQGSVKDGFSKVLERERKDFEKQIFTSRKDPESQKFLTSFKKGDYEKVLTFAKKGAPSTLKNKIIKMSQILIKMENNLPILEKALMLKHYDLVMKDPSLIPSLGLFPQVMKAFPPLRREIASKETISILDLFLLQNPPSNFLLETSPILLKNYSLSAQKMLKEPKTGLLFLVEVQWKGRFFPIAKVLKNKIVFYSKTSSTMASYPSIRLLIQKQGMNSTYSNFKKPTLGIENFLSSWGIYIIMFVFITVLAAVSGFALKPLASYSLFSLIYALGFSLFLSFLYYGWVQMVIKEFIPFFTK